VKSLFFIPYRTGDNVFPIMFLGWTLNYEMFFYLLFAASMAISHAYRAVICSAVLVALAIVGWMVEFESVILEFFTESIIVEFAFGMFCYSVFARTAEWRARAGNGVRTLMVIAGLVLIACMPLMSAQSEIIGRPFAWGLLALGAFLLIVHGLANRRLPRFAVLVGDASYSLYLFHPYVLNVFSRVLRPSYDPGSPSAYLMALLAIAVCCGVAVVLYRLLELPLTTWLRRKFLPRRSEQSRGVDAGAVSAP
jgi:peptidoglycan/LPS O-acetylase OafA/YrhL